MMEPLVKCEECGEVVDGEGVLEYMEETGHNSWEMVEEKVKE